MEETGEAVLPFLFAVVWMLSTNNIIQNFFSNLSLRLQVNSQKLSVNALYKSPSNSFASFIEDLEMWLESFDTEKTFYIVSDTNVLKNNS